MVNGNLYCCLLFPGIGYETAKYIAMMGAKVVLACRSEQKANEVRIPLHILIYMTGSFITKNCQLVPLPRKIFLFVSYIS